MKNDWPRLGRMVSSEGFETGRAKCRDFAGQRPWKIPVFREFSRRRDGVFFCWKARIEFPFWPEKRCLFPGDSALHIACSTRRRIRFPVVNGTAGQGMAVNVPDTRCTVVSSSASQRCRCLKFVPCWQRGYFNSKKKKWKNVIYKFLHKLKTPVTRSKTKLMSTTRTKKGRVTAASLGPAAEKAQHSAPCPK